MIRSNTPQASLRMARKAPFATRGAPTKPVTANDTGEKTPKAHSDVALTPEQEHICDRATD
jgi:hypothetical protein